MNNGNDIAFHSVISAIQKVALYETKTVKKKFSFKIEAAH